jgi:glutathione S-transferase
MKAAASLIFPSVADILDERGRIYFCTTREKRFKKPLSEMRPQTNEEAVAVREEVEAAIKPLIDVLKSKELANPNSGPFFEGNKPSYADFILVSFLAWFERAEKGMWESY